jgi:cytochrome c
MPERRIASSVIFLAALVLFSIAVALIAGGTLYFQNRTTTETQAETMTHGHVANGRLAIQAYGCGSCHMIPGIHGANGKVGPDLTGVAQRTAIAGALPNDPETMIRWLEHPQALRPGSGMPEMGVTEANARNMAAYLYSKQ